MTDAFLATLAGDIDVIRLPIDALAGYIPSRKLLVLSDSLPDEQVPAVVQQVMAGVASGP